MTWSKSIVYWRDGDDDVNVSVPFTWLLPAARKICLWNKGYSANREERVNGQTK